MQTDQRLETKLLSEQSTDLLTGYYENLPRDR
jgi:hypothetical protein